ncbi:hypothetical protein HYX13_02570 [Candidatus Woesearchaeota archaeon]|nr:hypothetical protein [Candidatus Woesearchaeota archaeon]
MKKTLLHGTLVLIFALTLVVFPLAAEAEIESEEIEEEFEEIVIPSELEALQQELIGKELPGPLGKLFGDQRINFHLELDSGESIISGIIIEKKIVKNIQIAEVSNPTLEIKTTEVVIRSAMQSSAPAATLQKAMKDKQITIRTHGFVNGLKFKFISGLVSVAGLFSDDEVAPTEVISREDAGMPAQDVTGGVVSGNTNSKEEENEADTSVNENSETENADDEGSDDIVSSEPEVILEVSGPKTHTVALITGGFAVPTIEIKVGDTVSWVNDRAEVVNKGFRRAMLIGAQKCSKLKSGFFMPGESYSWTFNEPSTCLIVDGLYTTQTMKVTVTK